MLSCFTACKPKRPEPISLQVTSSVLGSWQLAQIGTDNRKSNASRSDRQTALQHDLEELILQKGVMISFFPDSTCSMFVGDLGFRIVKWGYTDHQHAVVIIDSGKANIVFIKHAVEQQQQVLNILNTKSKTENKYIQYAPALADYRNDPFYPDNNIWRIRPAHAESDAELQKRLENYFQHLLCILKSASDRNQQTVSFEYSAGIVKIYDGGIGVADETNIPRSWEKIFFNTDQAHAAFNMYRSYMLRTHFHGKGTGNWLIDDHMLLSNICDDLRDGKFADSKKTK